jgi:hypothetical protein
MMPVSPEKCESASLVGLVEVTLPAGPALRHIQLDEHTYMVGYDPARITIEIVQWWLDRELPAGYQLVDGVPQ